MNLIQQAVERAKELEGQGKVIAPVTQTGPRTEGRLGTSPAASSPRIGLASLPHIEPIAARGPMPLLLVLLVAVLALGGGALLYFFLAKSQSIENRIVTAVAAVTAPAKPAVETPATDKPATPAVAAVAVAPTPTTAAATPTRVAPEPALAAAVATPAPAAATAVAAPAAAGAAALQDARNAVEGWARAWSERDVDAYLAYYGQGFRPDKGQSRRGWEASRRLAIGKRGNITVALRDLQVEALAGDRIAARFSQDYTADSYRETGTAKTLLLAREATGWRIVSETAATSRLATR